MHSLTSHFGYVLFWRRCRWRYCGNFRQGPLSSASLHLDVKSQVVQVFQNPFPRQKFHFVPRASTVSRRLHCSPGGFLRTGLHLSKPCFVPTRCSSDDAPRPHQQPLIHLFVSLAARESKRIPIHQTCTKVIHMEFRANIGMGFCRRVAL